MEIKISSRHPRLATIMAPDIVTVDRLQRKINHDTVFLEYFIGSRYVYLWVITHTTAKFYRLKPSKQTGELLDQFYYFISDSTMSYSRKNFEIGHQLFKCLFHNNDDRFILDENRIAADTIFIIPDKALFKLPFEALVTDIQKQSPNFLIDNGYKITCLPSSTTYCLLQQQYESAKKIKTPLSVLALGDPVYPLDDEDYEPHEKIASLSHQSERSQQYVSKQQYLLARIPNTSTEVRQIQAIFERHQCRPENVKILLRKDANEQFIKQLNESGHLKNFQYLHFACHGLLGLDIPWLKQAVLVLSQHPDQQEDGFLKLKDIFNLRLNARLVVLSACQTALGKEYKGEGLIGLTRGFMFAGSLANISSLWSVADKETSDFMAMLYLNLIEAKKEAIAALYETKIRFKQENNHPFYWAPFIHIGI